MFLTFLKHAEIVRLGSKIGLWKVIRVVQILTRLEVQNIGEIGIQKADWKILI